MKFRLNLFRDHRKILIVDGTQAFIGGTGIADAFAATRSQPWRDNMLQVQGECVDDWQRLFEDNWRRWSDTPIALSRYQPIAAHCQQKGRVVAGQNLTARKTKHSAMRHIRQAKRRVWLASAYFLPPWGLRRVLAYAADSGIDVRLLLPGKATDHPAVRLASHRLYGYFLRHNIRIFEYQPRFLHAKALLCDDVVSIGSSNLDRWSLRWNFEANQEAEDVGLAQQMQAVLEKDFALSQEITLEWWQARPLWHRIKIKLWGWIGDWMVRQSYRTRIRLQARDEYRQKKIDQMR